MQAWKLRVTIHKEAKAKRLKGKRQRAEGPRREVVASFFHIQLLHLAITLLGIICIAYSHSPLHAPSWMREKETQKQSFYTPIKVVNVKVPFVLKSIITIVIENGETIG